MTGQCKRCKPVLRLAVVGLVALFGATGIKADWTYDPTAQTISDEEGWAFTIIGSHIAGGVIVGACVNVPGRIKGLDFSKPFVDRSGTYTGISAFGPIGQGLFDHLIAPLSTHFTVGANLVLPTQVVEVGNYVFSHVKAGGDLVIPASLETLGEGAFSNMDMDGTLTFESRSGFGGGTIGIGKIGLQHIPDFAFQNSGFTGTVDIPASVTGIGAAAFAGTSLSEIVMPSSTGVVLNPNVFADNLVLTAVRFGGGYPSFPKVMNLYVYGDPQDPGFSANAISYILDVNEVPGWQPNVTGTITADPATASWMGNPIVAPGLAPATTVDVSFLYGYGGNATYATATAAVGVDTYGDIFPKEHPERTGYQFSSWTLEGTALTGTETVIIDTNHCAEAAWKANTYTVQFNANGGSGMMKSMKFTYDEAHALYANNYTWEGHTFAGWTNLVTSLTYADEETVLNLTDVPNGTVTLHALWVPRTDIQVSFTYTYDGMNWAIYHTTNVTYGTAYNLYFPPEPPPPPGQIFGYWTFNHVDITHANVETAAPHSLVAFWISPPPICDWYWDDTTLSRTRMITNAFGWKFKVAIVGQNKQGNDLLSVTNRYARPQGKLLPGAYDLDFSGIIEGNRIIVNFGDGVNPIDPEIPAQPIGNPIPSPMQSLTLPDSATNVAARAFLTMPDLSALDLGNGLRHIREYAFSCCTSLSGTLTIPGSVRDIDSHAFYDCTGINELILNDGVTNIGKRAFFICPGLAGGTLIIPNTVTLVEESAFAGTGLAEIHTPSTGVTFNESPFLTAIEMPLPSENYPLNVYYGGEYPASVQASSFYDSDSTVTSYIYAVSGQPPAGWEDAVNIELTSFNPTGEAIWQGKPIICIGYMEDDPPPGSDEQWLDIGSIRLTAGGDIVLGWGTQQITLDTYTYVLHATDDLTAPIGDWATLAETTSEITVSVSGSNAETIVAKAALAGKGLNTDRAFFRLKAMP